MIYDPTNSLQKNQAIERFKYFLSKDKRFELKAKHDKRSISQNNYLHLILSFFGLETGYTLLEVKQEIFKKIVNPTLFYEGEFGKVVKIERWRSSATLDKAEMTLAITRFRNFASVDFGIYLPEPEDLVLLQEIERELSKSTNKEFL